MLTKEEKEYLDKIPTDKKVIVRPYDPNTPQIVDEFIKRIKSVTPELEVRFLGASVLGISGQGDIDLSILCAKETFIQHAEKLKSVLGDPVLGISLTMWQFEREGHEIEIYLADPNDPSATRQLKAQEILSNNPVLLKEYEKLKEDVANQPYREYQRRKYEFYNRILK